jgi:hypothetical protein
MPLAITDDSLQLKRILNAFHNPKLRFGLAFPVNFRSYISPLVSTLLRVIRNLDRPEWTIFAFLMITIAFRVK